jgi:hypothetical protein
MDEPASKPDGTEPVVDSGRRCGKCGYNLTGLRKPVRCPECGQQWPISRLAAANIESRKRTLIALDVAIAGTVVLMLLVSPGGSMMIMVPPAGLMFRLLLFPVQWVLAFITLAVAARTTGPPELDRFVRWIGFAIPLVTVALTLFFGGQILRFKGLLQ